MKPMQVHICMWIYFAASIFWLISSITLLTSMCETYVFYSMFFVLQLSISAISVRTFLISLLFLQLMYLGVRYINLRRANCYLFVWIFLTLFLCILDLGLGVAFAIDYDTLRVNVLEESHASWRVFWIHLIFSLVFVLCSVLLSSCFANKNLKKYQARSSQCHNWWEWQHRKSIILFTNCGENGIGHHDEHHTAWIHHMADQFAVVHLLFYSNIQNFGLQSVQGGHRESNVCPTDWHNAEEGQSSNWSIWRKVCPLAYFLLLHFFWLSINFRHVIEREVRIAWTKVEKFEDWKISMRETTASEPPHTHVWFVYIIAFECCLLFIIYYFLFICWLFFISTNSRFSPFLYRSFGTPFNQ